MRQRLKQLIRVAMAPAVRWIQAQLAVLDQRLTLLQHGQDDLGRLNQAALEANSASIDIIGRELAKQRLLLESLEQAQVELLAEVRAAGPAQVAQPAAAE